LAAAYGLPSSGDGLIKQPAATATHVAHPVDAVEKVTSEGKSGSEGGSEMSAAASANAHSAFERLIFSSEPNSRAASLFQQYRSFFAHGFLNRIC
jgi:hypothetical protein